MQYQGGKYIISSDVARIIGGGVQTNLRYQGGKSRIANELAQAMRGGGMIAMFSFHCFAEHVM